MDQVGPLLTAVLAGNLLTALFLYGMHHAFKVKDGREARWSTLGHIFIPLAFLAGGAYLYW
jgi:hypothetical protein